MMSDTNASSNYSPAVPQCFMLETNTESTEYLFVAHILTSIINGISSLTAIFGNVVVILAVWKTPELQTQSNVFLCCLAFSDFMVGLIAQPAFVVHKIGELYRSQFTIYCTTRILLESLGFITACASLFTMSGIAVERHLALSLHLRYQAIVTTKRILMAVSLSWVSFILLAASRFWIANENVFNIISISVILSSLLVTLIAYVKIAKCVRRHEKQILNQSIEVGDLPGSYRGVTHRLSKMKRYKKSTLTMVYIVATFITCYTPYLSVKLLHRIKGYTVEVKTANLYACTLVFLNSSLNPTVYCWRIKDMRNAAKDICFRCFGVKREAVTSGTSFVQPSSAHFTNVAFTAKWSRNSTFHLIILVPRWLDLSFKQTRCYCQWKIVSSLLRERYSKLCSWGWLFVHVLLKLMFFYFQ